MREELVKGRIKKILTRYRVNYWMPPANRYGVSGFPDFVGPLEIPGLPHAAFLTIEAKGDKGTLRASQEGWRDDILDARGLWFLIDHRNYGELHLMLWLTGAVPTPLNLPLTPGRSLLPPEERTRKRRR